MMLVMKCALMSMNIGRLQFVADADVDAYGGNGDAVRQFIAIVHSYTVRYDGNYGECCCVIHDDTDGRFDYDDAR